MLRLAKVQIFERQGVPKADPVLGVNGGDLLSEPAFKSGLKAVLKGIVPPALAAQGWICVVPLVWEQQIVVIIHPERCVIRERVEPPVGCDDIVNIEVHICIGAEVGDRQAVGQVDRLAAFTQQLLSFMPDILGCVCDIVGHLESGEMKHGGILS